MPAVASAAVTRPASSGSWRDSTLWIILRRSRKAAWTRRHSSSSVSGSRRSSASYGSTTMTADSTAGSGSKAAAGTANAIRTRAWYWTKTDR